jgi:aldose 1-epimerase
VANVVLGAVDLAGYAASDAHFGALIGRYANRIAGGRFKLDGQTYQLPRNEGRNTMHGGPEGFDRRVWRVEAADATSLTLAYRSPDGEQGFPGNLDVTVTYRLEDDDTLAIDYAAVTDRPTIVNLTNHSYFNLAGEGAGSALGHVVTVAADTLLETDAEQIPTGAILPVAGTPFDFRTATALGARIRAAHPQLALAHGYDHTYVLGGDGTLRVVARAVDPESGRCLTVATTQPGLQLYTANMLDGTVTGSGGGLYRAGDAVCFEAQGFPDAPNHPDFPSTVLRPDAPFRATTTYRFGTVP